MKLMKSACLLAFTLTLTCGYLPAELQFLDRDRAKKERKDEEQRLLLLWALLSGGSSSSSSSCQNQSGLVICIPAGVRK
ncbi:MAG: hypothetical protein HS115_06355 [Spirochaetales bacterium]|nr:hypothetical protein [Spirochaetales bacterium]